MSPSFGEWFWIGTLLLVGIVMMQLGQVFTYGGAVVLFVGLVWGALKLGERKGKKKDEHVP